MRTIIMIPVSPVIPDMTNNARWNIMIMAASATACLWWMPALSRFA